MRAAEFIDGLAARGQHHFTTHQATETIGASDVAVRAQLRRLKKRGLIASPMRSFHVIVPPEYRCLGCPPAEHFIDQLMNELGEPYYVGLLSAAERHGAAHQRPQLMQVMVEKNRAKVECGATRIVFIARAEIERMPVSVVNTPRGTLRYSTPEVTALELVGYPRKAGGLSNVATVLTELAEVIDRDKLVEVARLCPVSWSQRLGYLLEQVEWKNHAGGLASFVNEAAASYAPLRRANGVTGAKRDAKWKLVINAEVDPDL